MKEMYINCLYPDSYLWAIKVNCNRAYKIKINTPEENSRKREKGVAITARGKRER